MNRSYRLVWSRVQKTWVAAAENTRSRGKDGGRVRPAMVAAALATSLVAATGLAAPSGGKISMGLGSIGSIGSNTIITQTSQNLAINWHSFNIDSSESVRFDQPNSSAIALNRILGPDASQILGKLSANGQVFILNPNGVLFGNGAEVNVGGLVATDLGLGDKDFSAGKHKFKKGNTSHSTGITNQGNLTAAQGGYIALLSARVSNQGTITTPQGKTLLAAGSQISLNIDNGSLLGYTISKGAIDPLAENRQLIQADGGQVMLTAEAANDCAKAEPTALAMYASALCAGMITDAVSFGDSTSQSWQGSKRA